MSIGNVSSSWLRFDSVPPSPTNALLNFKAAKDQNIPLSPEQVCLST